jgi:hypothetical protein
MTVIRLSARSLKTVRSSQVEKTFKFLVDDECHDCHWFVAEFLSPVLSELRRADPSVDCYRIRTQNCSGIIEKLISLGYGDDVEVPLTTRDLFVSLCTELGNEDLCCQILDSVKLTCDNVLGVLKMKREAVWDCSTELEFAASHFHELLQSDIEGLNMIDLSNVLTSRSLRIQSEDWLYEVVKHFVKQREEDFWLFEFVWFEYLSAESISSFVEMSENHLSSLNLVIWRSICARLLQSECKAGMSDRTADGRLEVTFRSSSPLDGIIAHLTREHHGNVHEVGVVNVTASSVYDSCREPKHAVDMTENCCFGTGNIANGWLCYDFKTSRICPTHYSIRSWNNPWGTGLDLISWVIEISKDGETWQEVDRHHNDRTFVGGAVGSFAISKPCDPSRFVRLRQTGKNSNGGSDYLVITSFELFGHLIRPRK